MDDRELLERAAKAAGMKRKAALWDAINAMWSFPGRTLEEVVLMVLAERAAAMEGGSE